MRIFFPNASIFYPPTDGSHIHQYQLIKNLKDLGHEFITLQPDQNPCCDVQPKTAFSVLKAIRWAQVIYCRTNEGLNSATALTRYSRRFMIPRRCAVIWQLDLDIRITVAQIRRRQHQIESHERELVRRAQRVDAAIGVSELIAERARQVLGIEPVFTIQNGSDPETFRPDVTPVCGLQGRSEKLNVTWIGSASNSIHDVALIRELCGVIVQDELPIRLHVIGRTESEFKPPHPDCLVVHGPVAYQELPRYLAGMDVGLALYNIRYDGGSPLKLFDYMASGCVPVCSPSQSMEEVLALDPIGFIGKWNARSLADQLMQLHSNPQLMRQLSANGRRWVQCRFSWRRIAERTDQIIQEAVARRSG